MFTPSEIQEKQFKTGLGYDKKDVEQFLQDLSSDYTALLKETEDLKKKAKEQTETIAYYKSIEKTLQKALILAEKAAQNTRATALREADTIEKEARTKASIIVAESKKQVEILEHKTLNLMQQYDLFRIHFENLLNSQLELINSKSFLVNSEDFTYKDAGLKDLENAEKLQPFSESGLKDVAATLQDPEDIDQLQFDFMKEEEESYQTEDGFEFFTMKDE